jgi:lipopolysaccharide export system protein LptA
MVLGLITLPSHWLAAADSPIGDSQGPISISADHMSSDQNLMTVTFTGRVIARQDDLVITCDLMRVHYQSTQTADNTPTSPTTGASPQPPQPNDTNNPGSQPLPTGSSKAASTSGSLTSDLSLAPPTSPNAPLVQTSGQLAQATEASNSVAPSDDSSANPLSGNQEIHRVDCEGSVKIQQGNRLGVGQKALYLAKSQPRRLILTGEARIWEGNNSVTGHQVVYYLDQNRSQVDSSDNGRVRAFLEQDGTKK